MNKDNWFKYKTDKFKDESKFTTADWGKMAVTGILAGALKTIIPKTITVGFMLLDIIVDAIVLLGWASLFVWIYRKVKKI